jgi:hypothetical protein
VQFSDYPIMKIHLNNTGEFISQAFDNFCTFIGIDIKHHVAHIHIQNGLAKSFTKRLQLIVKPLFMKLKLPIFVWGYTILHVASLVRIKSSAYHKYFPL